MSPRTTIELQPGNVYRTRELSAWSRHPTRLAARLVREGRLTRLGRGLLHCPRKSRWGDVPPSNENLLRAFLCGDRFLVTGPPIWNALGLGSTSLFAVSLVYNTRRSGTFEFGGHRLLLRRVAFPEHPTPEWFAVDLIEHHGMACADPEVLESGLTLSLRIGRLDAKRVAESAAEYGTRSTKALVGRAISASRAVA